MTGNLSKDTIETYIAQFESKFKVKIKVKQRERFLTFKYESTIDLEKRLSAYRVFGDLGFRGL